MINPGNGSAATPQQLSLGPNDRFVLIIVDPATKAIQTVAPNIADPVEVAQILAASMGSVLQVIVDAREKPKSNIITLPPGARLVK